MKTQRKGKGAPATPAVVRAEKQPLRTPAPKSESPESEPWRWCPRCGRELHNEKCKFKCPRCHYFMSCSDFD